jgi:hypothetical protein
MHARQVGHPESLILLCSSSSYCSADGVPVNLLITVSVTNVASEVSSLGIGQQEFVIHLRRKFEVPIDVSVVKP